MKKCPKCEAEHDKPGKFCSLKCANSRKFSDDDKVAIRNGINSSEKVKKMIEESRVNQIEKTCPMCESLFRVSMSRSEQIYCSRQCFLNDSSCHHRTKTPGGYREGSGRAKTGYYKGIYCGSTYELAWVIYQIDHGNKFERFPGFLEFGGKKYFPDFIQNEKIVEIKGYESQESVDIKNNIAKENGYEVIVLRKDDLQTEFHWVKENYSSDFKTLYDEYKPKYNYVCVCCDSPFSRDKPINAKHITCSRSCSLKMNRKVSGNNQYTHREAAGVATSPSN